MKRLSVLILGLCAVFGWTSAGAAAKAEAGTANRDVALTIYSGDIGVVTEQRPAELVAGSHHLTFDQVATQLLPQTVSIERPGLTVLNQHFAYRPPSRAGLLQRFVGEKVRLFPRKATDPALGRDAWLLSAAGDAPVVRIDGRIETIGADSPWRIVFPAAVFELPAMPSIEADVDVTEGGQKPLVLSYLTHGLAWRLDYVAKLDMDGGKLILTGLASIDNHSGVAYPDAQIRLVAGEIHREAAPRPALMRAMTAQSRVASADYAAPSQAFEYYTYTLPHSLTLDTDSSIQVPLIAAEPLEVTREYRVDSSTLARPGAGSADEPVHARVLLHGENTLKRPLPAGIVRIFTHRGEDVGSLWLGEDRLPAVPAGESFTLEAGRAFDVTARRIRTAQERLADKREAASWQVTLRNAKDEAVTVRVVEALPESWTITSESDKHESVDARHVAWKLKVPAGGKRTLTYRVEWKSG